MARRSLAERLADVSLRAKITAVTVFILFLGLIVAGVGTLTLLQPLLIQTQDNTLRQLHGDPASALAQGADTRELTRNDVLYASSQYYVAVLDADGELRYDNARGAPSSAKPRVPRLSLDRVEKLGEDISKFTSPDGSTWHGITVPIFSSTDPGDPNGTLLIASSTAWANRVLAQYIVIFSGFGVAVILLGAALTRILLTTTLMPLAQVEKTALEISRGDYSKRIMVASPHTEVGHLGESLNVMLDRLDGSLADRARTIDQMRRFVGDAGHELRTPLVSVRGYAELYRMGALQEEEQVGQAMERIEKEAIRMTSLVEDLLSLARLDERKPLELAELSLNDLANDAALDAGVQAPERTITAVTDPSRPVVVGDEHRVRQLMTNLIGNALRHTPEGTPIEVVVSRVLPAAPPPPADGPAEPAGKTRPAPASAPVTGATATIQAPAAAMARFEIVDHGEGVPEQIRDKIFDRFWRADTSRNRETGGSGLGLAIVKSIVDLHGGEVSVHETPGGGATFRVDLPAPSGAPSPQG